MNKTIKYIIKISGISALLGMTSGSVLAGLDANAAIQHLRNQGSRLGAILQTAQNQSEVDISNLPALFSQPCMYQSVVFRENQWEPMDTTADHWANTFFEFDLNGIEEIQLLCKVIKIINGDEFKNAFILPGNTDSIRMNCFKVSFCSNVKIIIKTWVEYGDRTIPDMYGIDIEYNPTSHECTCINIIDHVATDGQIRHVEPTLIWSNNQ